MKFKIGDKVRCKYKCKYNIEPLIGIIERVDITPNLNVYKIGIIWYPEHDLELVETNFKFNIDDIVIYNYKQYIIKQQYKHTDGSNWYIIDGPSLELIEETRLYKYKIDYITYDEYGVIYSEGNHFTSYCDGQDIAREILCSRFHSDIKYFSIKCDELELNRLFKNECS